MPTDHFVAVGEQGLRLFSTDGTDWKQRQTGKDGEVYRAACFGKGRAVVLGTYGGRSIFASTSDGEKWQTDSKDGRDLGTVRSLGFGKDVFVGVGGDAGFGNYAKPCAVQSSDGVAWSDFRAFPGKAILRRLAFGNERFVGVGDSGRRAASADGWKWDDAPDVKAIDTLVDVAFGKGVFVGVGLHGLRMRSEDGLKWADRQVGEEGEHLNAILWAGDRFVAVGIKATYTSPDGVKWERHVARNGPLAAAFGNGVFVGSRWKGRLLRSTDGIDWREVHKSEYHIEALAHGSLA
ncbi:MAG: hypothetical protein K2R98_19945 [Gemmataceae bacterium]|nr:hypothetical protein [Gemmataceae bacterium]